MGIKTVVLLTIVGLAFTQTHGISLRTLLENLGQGEGGSTLTLEGLAHEFHDLKRHMMAKNKMELGVLNMMAEGTLEFLCKMAHTLTEGRDSIEDLDSMVDSAGDSQSPPDPAVTRRELIKRILEGIQGEEGGQSGPKEGPLLSKICPLLKGRDEEEGEGNIPDMP